MEMFIKVFGLVVKKMGKENIIIIMEFCTKDHLLMAERVALELLLSPRKLKSKHIGIKLIYKVKGKYFIAMEITLKEIIIFHRNQGKEYIYGKILNIKDNFLRIVCRVQQL